MLTAGMSDTGWCMVAVFAGLAAGAVLAVLCETWPKRLGALVLPPLVALAYALFRTLVQGESAREALYLYTLAMSGMAVTGLIYLPWMRRQIALHREGKPAATTEDAGRHSWIFLGTFVVAVVGAAFLVH